MLPHTGSISQETTKELSALIFRVLFFRAVEYFSSTYLIFIYHIYLPYALHLYAFTYEARRRNVPIEIRDVVIVVNDNQLSQVANFLISEAESAMKTWVELMTIIFSTLMYVPRCSWGAINGVPSSENALWYENLPAVAMDYKVKIDAGKEDCYYQYVQPGATFYANFQVLRGGDGMAGFAVKDPSGAIVHPYQWLAQSDYQGVSTTGGYYSVCVDNQFSRFSEKLVNLYITVIKYDQWEQFNKQIEEMNLSVMNVTTSLSNVEHRINTMLQYQHHSRSKESRDYNLLLDNNLYVIRWSLLQITCIIATSLLQVYFVRQLFDVKKNRPRA